MKNFLVGKVSIFPIVRNSKIYLLTLSVMFSILKRLLEFMLPSLRLVLIEIRQSLMVGKAAKAMRCMKEY